MNFEFTRNVEHAGRDMALRFSVETVFLEARKCIVGLRIPRRYDRILIRRDWEDINRNWSGNTDIDVVIVPPGKQFDAMLDEINLKLRNLADRNDHQATDNYIAALGNEAWPLMRGTPEWEAYARLF